ncbi:MAG: hypothetical protein RL885_11775 [Planctomycetota bacterium]
MRLATEASRLGIDSIRRAHQGGWLGVAFEAYLPEDADSEAVVSALERCVAYARLAGEAEERDGVEAVLPIVLWGEALRAFEAAGLELADGSTLESSITAFDLLANASDTGLEAEARALTQTVQALDPRELATLIAKAGEELRPHFERWIEYPESMPPWRVIALMGNLALRNRVVALTRRRGLGGRGQCASDWERRTASAVARAIETAFARVLAPAVARATTEVLSSPRSTIDLQPGTRPGPGRAAH